VSDLEARLLRLEDERAILDVLHAYGHSIDYGDRELWLSCWAEDATLIWPHAAMTGHDEIGAAFDAHSHAPEKFLKHFMVEPGPDGAPFVRSMGRYRDRLRRGDDGRWRFVERLTEREGLVPGAPVT
jgi:ketosteroid isomerase-like protein